jgi:hypothetical protein
MFYEAWKHGDAGLDFILSEIANALRDHMLGLDNPLSKDRWRLAGYKFAKFLAHGSEAGVESAREFAIGVRTYIEEAGPIGAPILFDSNRADAIEDKARKLLNLATHDSANEQEARNAARGFTGLFVAQELAIIAGERFDALRSTLARFQDTIAFMKKEHPTLFLWKRDHRIDP